MSRMASSALHQAKATLRKELKSRLAAMTEEERLKQSVAISQKLIAMPQFEASRRISLYLHMKEEVQTLSILKHLFSSNKECFIPQYFGADMKMVKLASLEDYESLPETKWKIKQPADDDVRPDAIDTGGLDIILMPGLGFTRDGDRIGRGKGYYDNYLMKCQNAGKMPLTIALAYSQQICDSIPLTENDMKVNFVLSPD